MYREVPDSVSVLHRQAKYYRDHGAKENGNEENIKQSFVLFSPRNQLQDLTGDFCTKSRGDTRKDAPISPGLITSVFSVKVSL